MIGRIRKWAYRGGLIKPVQLPGFVVSVGNLSLGGTGKSPFVMLLCEWALRRNLTACVLTRGYKRKTNALEIIPAHAPLPEVSRLGDEPWMIRNRAPGISLLVHADRARMAMRHWQELGSPQLVLMDDAFQHWRAARDRDVLMLDATESIEQSTFPFGRLRESAEALARADLVVISRAASLSAEALSGLEAKVRDLASAKAEHPWKRGRSTRLRIIAVDYQFLHFFDLETGKECDRPKEPRLVLVSGVAKPDGVRSLVRSLQVPVKEEIYFPDHHRLSSGDLASLRSALKAQGPEAALLTTEKDWARWRGELGGLRGYGVRVGFRFFGDGETVLQQFLQEVEECITSR